MSNGAEIVPLIPAPKVDVELHKITCPYCVVGWAEVVIERPHGGISVDIKSPRQCVKCSRYFKLKPRVQFVGVQMEESKNG